MPAGRVGASWAARAPHRRCARRWRRGELDGGAGGGHAVLAVGKGVGLCSQLDPGHITQHQLGAIGTGPQHDGGERLGSRQLPLYREGDRQPLARQGGFVAEAPRCNLYVLLLDGLRHLADGQPVGGEFARSTQMRMACSAPNSCTRPTPSMRRSSCTILRAM